MKALQRPPDDYASSVQLAHRIAPRPVAESTALYAGYEDLKVRKNQFDFEDLLLHATALLETEPDVAAQVRDQYRYFVVDEYQDVNPAQQRLLDAWLGDRDDLCVVGDPEQTIYSFAGASPDYLTGFATRYPEGHRRAAGSRLPVDAAGRRAGQPAVGRRAGRASCPRGPVPVVDSYDDEVGRGDGRRRPQTAKLIADGTPASEIAVLFRINAQSETFEQALAEAGVPYVLRGGERFFERPEVREAVFLLRGAARGRAARRRHARRRRARRARRASGSGPMPPAGSGVARDRWESLAALVRLADERVRAPDATPDAATSRTSSPTSKNARRCSTRPVVDGVTLASLHAAKGLEWDAVFLVGLVDGTLPIVYAETTGAGRRGAPAALRRHHPGAPLSRAVVGGGAVARRARQSASEPLSRRRCARPTAGGSAQPGAARSP